MRIGGLGAAFCVMTAARAQAQDAPPSPETTPATTAVAAAGSEDETVVLSPFIVTEDETHGYRATSTLAGTRINTKLSDVGSAISVVTAEFLRDTGATNNQSLLVYTTNTEVGGIGGNFAGTGNGQTLDETSLLRTPQTNTRVRGLAAADNTRDFFLTDIPWNGYNVERVDMQRGPNGILFGLGSPAGIINTTTNSASFKEKTTIEARYGSYGSYRGVLDINHVLRKDELAVRFEAMRDDTEYRQDPAFNLDKRYYAALRFDPAFLNKGSAHTSLRVNYEYGDITANRPRSLTPRDNITPWFSSDFNKATYDPFKSWVVDTADPLNSGQHLQASQVYNPWLGDFGGGTVLGGIYLTYADVGSSEYDTPRTGEVDTRFGRKSDGTIDQDIGGIQFNRLGGIASYSTYATHANLQYADLGQYKDKYITDPSIFDFWNKLLDGPNASQWEGFEAVNAALSQTFLNNRLGFEFVYDRQRYHNGQVSGGDGSIQVDINSNLTDGTANPNVGRAYTVIGSSYGNQSYATKRENVRLTGFADVRFTDFMKPSLLTSILGRHVFTGLYSTERKDDETRAWNRWVTDSLYGSTYLNSSYMTDSYRQVRLISYLGGSLSGASSASGANLSNVSATLTPPTSSNVKIWDSRWNASGVNYSDPYTTVRSYFNQTTAGLASTQAENPENYIGWASAPFTVLNSDTGDINRLYNAATKTREKVTTKAAVWQGYFWDNTIVGTVGLRNDEAKSYTKTAPTNSDNSVNVSDPTYVLPSDPDNVVSGHSTTWSIVAHTPRFIKQQLPAGMDLSVFYNRSSNFQPAAGRVNVLGESIGAPSGKTREVGVLVSAFDDRLSLKVNWYRTEVKDASLDNVLPLYLIGYTEQWGYEFAMINKNNYGPSWQWDYAANPWAGQTAEQADAIKQAATTAWLANLPSDQFYNAWHIDRSDSAWQNRLSTYVTPTGLTVTGDTVSTGIEYELTAQITKNWSLTANATKDSARRVNLGGSLEDWINARTAVYNTDAGLIRYWWAGSTDTMRSVWNANFLSSWKLLLMQQNGDVPELRPWHFNVVTNYRFTRGWLRGANIGGGYRWQDGVVIGYPVITDADGNSTFNLNSPYKGPSESNIDLWVGYEHKLTEKINWRIQFNVKNAFAKKELIPISTQPDGSGAAYRIPELTTWSLTNTLSF